MKVQSNKPESQSQMTTRSDVAIQADETSSDFFSAMIANLLSAPVLSSQSDSATDVVPSDTQNDDVNQTQMLNAKAASSQLMSELMVNLLNASLQASTGVSAAATDIHTPSQQTSSQMEQEVLTTQKLLDAFPSLSQETDIEKIPQAGSKAIDAVQREMLFKQDNQLLSGLSENSNRQTQNEVFTQSLNNGYENTNALPDNLVHDVVSTLIRNDKQNKLYAYQDLKNQNHADETALQQLNNPDKMSHYQSFISTNDVTRQANVSEEQATIVYQSRNGKLDYQAETQNHYIDALVEMSGMINNRTSNLANMEQQIVNANSDGQTDYANAVKTTHLPEYELKIELQSQALDLTGKEVYHANIKIHPPELGAVIARLKIEKNSAELVIVAENNQVKGIVEANLSQLRENFQKHDINITSVHIDVQNPQSGMSDQGSKEQRAHDASENTDQTTDTRKQGEAVKKEAKQKLNSLIDTYA